MLQLFLPLVIDSATLCYFYLVLPFLAQTLLPTLFDWLLELDFDRVSITKDTCFNFRFHATMLAEALVSPYWPLQFWRVLIDRAILDIALLDKNTVARGSLSAVFPGAYPRTLAIGPSACPPGSRCFNSGTRVDSSQRPVSKNELGSSATSLAPVALDTHSAEVTLSIPNAANSVHNKLQLSRAAKYIKAKGFPLSPNFATLAPFNVTPPPLLPSAKSELIRKPPPTCNASEQFKVDTTPKEKDKAAIDRPAEEDSPSLPSPTSEFLSAPNASRQLGITDDKNTWIRPPPHLNPDRARVYLERQLPTPSPCPHQARPDYPEWCVRIRQRAKELAVEGRIADSTEPLAEDESDQRFGRPIQINPTRSIDRERRVWRHPENDRRFVRMNAMLDVLGTRGVVNLTPGYWDHGVRVKRTLPVERALTPIVDVEVLPAPVLLRRPIVLGSEIGSVDDSKGSVSVGGRGRGKDVMGSLKRCKSTHM